MGIALVVLEAAAVTAAVILMTVVIDRQQAGLRVTNTNPVENNRCNHFSCIVIYIYLVEHS